MKYEDVRESVRIRLKEKLTAKLVEAKELDFIESEEFQRVWNEVELLIEREIAFGLGCDQSDAWKLGHVSALRAIKTKPFKELTKVKEEIEVLKRNIKEDDKFTREHAIP